MKLIPTLASLTLILFAPLVSANDDLVLAINAINQAPYAQYWANQMGAGAQPFSHAPPELRPLQGENIFQQTATQCDAVHDTPLQNAVKAWLSQERLYTGQPISDGKEPWLHWLHVVINNSCRLRESIQRIGTM
ncbi:hypothetical protein Neosp_006498 [[Neocosmospora] mangrovei]